MGTRENAVEKYLDHCVKQLGGVTRKWVSPGRDGVPDRICIINGDVWFVEVKTIDGKLSSAQNREHARLKAAGANVATVYGDQGVEKFVEMLRL